MEEVKIKPAKIIINLNELLLELKKIEKENKNDLLSENGFFNEKSIKELNLTIQIGDNLKIIHKNKKIFEEFIKKLEIKTPHIYKTYSETINYIDKTLSKKTGFFGKKIIEDIQEKQIKKEEIKKPIIKKFKLAVIGSLILAIVPINTISKAIQNSNSIEFQKMNPPVKKELEITNDKTLNSKITFKDKREITLEEFTIKYFLKKPETFAIQQNLNKLYLRLNMNKKELVKKTKEISKKAYELTINKEMCSSEEIQLKFIPEFKRILKKKIA